MDSKKREEALKEKIALRRQKELEKRKEETIRSLIKELKKTDIYEKGEHIYSTINSACFELPDKRKKKWAKALMKAHDKFLKRIKKKTHTDTLSKEEIKQRLEKYFETTAIAKQLTKKELKEKLEALDDLLPQLKESKNEKKGNLLLTAIGNIYKDLPQKYKEKYSKKLEKLGNDFLKKSKELEVKREKSIEKELGYYNESDKKEKTMGQALEEEISKQVSVGQQIKEQRKPMEMAVQREDVINHSRFIRRYLKTGVPGFDELFDHGIPEGSSILIAGGPGTGKTVLCLNILKNAVERGEKCLYMSFEEPEERLRQHMHDFGWNIEKFEKEGRLLIKRFDPFDITRSIEALLTKAKKELLIDVEPVFFPVEFKPSRIVLDSMSAVAAAFVGREDSYRIYIEQLFRFFEKLGVTSFLITETEHPETTGLTKSGIEGFLADGIIMLYNVKREGLKETALEVLKMRGEGFKKKIVKMDILTGKGIVIYPDKTITGQFVI